MSALISTQTTGASRQSSVARLLQSRRTFDRLDWWSIEQWARSPLLQISAGAAILAVPADLSPTQPLNETQMDAAWLRWCAVADGVSASPLLPRLLDEAHTALAQAGIGSIFAILHPQDWLMSYLHDAGYREVDRMLTFEAALNHLPAHAQPAHLSLRAVKAGDLPCIEQIDARCFAPAWRYPPAIMQPAFQACAVFLLAEWRGAPAGYCCALLNEEHGHVLRLAVDPIWRNAGIGAVLLSHAERELAAQGAVTISLNTQGANLASQRLYARMGFSEMDERPSVLCKQLATLAKGRAGE